MSGVYHNKRGDLSRRRPLVRSATSEKHIIRRWMEKKNLGLIHQTDKKTANMAGASKRLQ